MGERCRTHVGRYMRASIHMICMVIKVRRCSTKQCRTCTYGFAEVYFQLNPFCWWNIDVTDARAVGTARPQPQIKLAD